MKIFLIPAMILLPMIFGLNGVLYAGPLADILAFTLTVIIAVMEIRNIRKISKVETPIKEVQEIKNEKGIVITIGREFGSGGKYIAEELSKRLGIKLYDEELLERVSEEKGIDIKLLEQADEKQKNSFWYTLAMSSFSNTDSVNSLTDLPTEDRIFIEEAKVIEELADTESCIIVGRCSNAILKDKYNVVNIFVYSSDFDFKVKRKIKLENIDEKAAIKLIHKTDKDREAYYNYFSNEKWGDRNGYDLSIDTSKLKMEDAIELIEKYVRIRKSEEVRA